MTAISRVQPETWAHIVSYLLRPKPVAGEQNERESIRQPELAAMMRVSKAFNQLAAPLLYHTVITDNIPALTYHRGDAASSDGIESKDQLMLRIKHLHVELTEKTFSFGGYKKLLRGGNWCPVGDQGILMAQHNTRISTQEHENVYTHTYHIHSKPSTGKLSNLRNLDTLSIGALLGGQDEWHARVWNGGQASGSKEAAEASSMFTTIWHNAGIDHLCSRAMLGPFAIWSICAPPVGHKMPAITLHLDKTSREPPIIMGGKTRWCYKLSPGGTMDTWDKFWWKILETARAKVYARYQIFHIQAPPGAPGPEDHTFDVEIYAPTPAPISQSLDLPATEADKRIWRLGAMRLEMALKKSVHQMVSQHGLAVPGWGEDKWVVKPIFDAPMCASCGCTYGVHAN